MDTRGLGNKMMNEQKRMIELAGLLNESMSFEKEEISILTDRIRKLIDTIIPKEQKKWIKDNPDDQMPEYYKMARDDYKKMLSYIKSKNYEKASNEWYGMDSSVNAMIDDFNMFKNRKEKKIFNKLIDQDVL